MPLFITYASYSHSGVKGLVDKPEDRSVPVKAMLEKAAANWSRCIIQQARTSLCWCPNLADGSDAVAMGMAVAGKRRTIQDRNGTRLAAERIQEHRRESWARWRRLQPPGK